MVDNRHINNVFLKGTSSFAKAKADNVEENVPNSKTQNDTIVLFLNPLSRFELFHISL